MQILTELRCYMISKVEIKPDVLNWAINESQLDNNILLDRYPQLSEWKSGVSKPTFKQIRDFCDYIKIPFGFIFLSTPPKDEQFKVEFRTISSKIQGNFSQNLKTTILEMDYRKSWMSELRENNGQQKLKWNFSQKLSDDYKTMSTKLRDLFGLPISWQVKKRNAYESFGIIREKVEKLGVLVMMSGIVGNDTHRTLSVSEFRAFALNDDYAPLIFINRNDTDNGLLFSIIHEFLHILVSREDDVFVGVNEHTQVEKEINEVTAEFLLPEDQLIGEFDQNEDHFNEIKRISDKYKISTMVTAIKAYKLGMIDEDLKDDILSEAIYYYNVHKQLRERKSDGGSFYSTTASRMSKDFYNTVIHQVEGGRIPYTHAYRLLGLRGKTFDKFREYVVGKLYG